MAALERKLDRLLLVGTECDGSSKQINFRNAGEPTFANDGLKKFARSGMCGYCFVALRNAISAVGRLRLLASLSVRKFPFLEVPL